jgi:hypothetical protein
VSAETFFIVAGFMAGLVNLVYAVKWGATIFTDWNDVTNGGRVFIVVAFLMSVAGGALGVVGGLVGCLS